MTIKAENSHGPQNTAHWLLTAAATWMDCKGLTERRPSKRLSECVMETESQRGPSPWHNAFEIHPRNYGRHVRALVLLRRVPQHGRATADVSTVPQKGLGSFSPLGWALGKVATGIPERAHTGPPLSGVRQSDHTGGIALIIEIVRPCFRVAVSLRVPTNDVQGSLFFHRPSGLGVSVYISATPAGGQWHLVVVLPALITGI